MRYSTAGNFWDRGELRNRRLSHAMLTCVSKQMRTEIIGNIIICFPCMSLGFNFSYELEHTKEQ